MNKELYVNKICEIINSNEFRNKLNFINNNYSNLKQENLIRNSILEELNTFYSNNSLDFKAFAEHPRINGSRVDLSIVDKQNKEFPFKIEFKFQYSKDLENYHRVIEKDFEFRNSDLFILTIANWDIQSKKEYDTQWNIQTNLSKYISKSDNWRQNIITSFKRFINTELIEIEKFEIDSPYKTEYNFYVLRRT